jgi:hypothetical protein
MIAALLLAMPASAKSTKESDGVELEVLSIIASNKDKHVDPQLAELAKQLKPTFKFSGYRLAGRTKRKVKMKQASTFKLVSPYSLQLKPTAREKDRVSLDLQAFREKDKKNKSVLKLKIKLRPGKYQLCGGWKVSKGTLLVAVRVVPKDKSDTTRRAASLSRSRRQRILGFQPRADSAQAITRERAAERA